MEEKRKGKGLVVLVILLVVVILGLVGYICYDKGIILSKKSQVENKNEKVVNTEKEEELDINSRLVQSLYNKVKPAGTEGTWDYGWNYYTEDKRNKLPEEIKNFNADDGNENIKMQIVSQNLLPSEKHEYYSCDDENAKKIPATNNYELDSICKTNNSLYGTNLYYYNRKYIEMVYKDIFGNDEELDTSVELPMDVFGINSYFYISELDQYVLYQREIGGTSGGDFRENITNAVKVDKELKIYADWIDTDLNDKSKKDIKKVVYTFKLDDDGMYSFVSRVKEK